MLSMKTASRKTSGRKFVHPTWSCLACEGQDRAQVYFVAEVSVTTSDSDIERAARRATILTGMTGSDAIAGIVTTSLDEDRGDSAHGQGVATLILEER